MKINILYCEQNSEEWYKSRLGFITASGFSKVLAKGQGKTRASYMREVAAEILTGESQEGFSNAYTEHGSNTEPEALARYEFDKSVTSEKVGFIHLENINIGCSPDGLIGNDGLVEFKCPKTTTQIETFLSGKMPTTHKAQVQGQLWITEREWCDFVSFDPRINGGSSYFCVRQYRDEDYIKSLESECYKFCDELNELVDKLK